MAALLEWALVCLVAALAADVHVVAVDVVGTAPTVDEVPRQWEFQDLGSK